MEDHIFTFKLENRLKKIKQGCQLFSTEKLKNELIAILPPNLWPLLTWLTDVLTFNFCLIQPKTGLGSIVIGNDLRCIHKTKLEKLSISITHHWWTWRLVMSSRPSLVLTPSTSISVFSGISSAASLIPDCQETNPVLRHYQVWSRRYVPASIRCDTE